MGVRDVLSVGEEILDLCPWSEGGEVTRGLEWWF